MTSFGQTESHTFLRPLFTLFIVCSLSVQGHAHHSQNDIKHIQEAFVKAYNDNEIDKFRGLFDQNMKARISVEKLEGNFNQLKPQVGNIKSMTLDEAKGKRFTYRSVHEKMITMKVEFELNDTGLLSLMLISNNYTYKDAPSLERNKTALELPFKGQWYTFWGGKSSANNYHNAYPNMKGSFDFWVMGENGKSHKEGASKNEDFYAFGKDILAPAEGEIFYVSDGLPDNNWPSMNRKAGYGNLIVLKTDHDEYFLFAHLKQHSIVVKAGDKVEKGQLLGLCGNSGNSTEPHLHFQLQNLPDLAAGKGAWIHFKELSVNGEIKLDYIPKRGDKVSN